MSYSDLLLTYARKGPFPPFRKSAFRKFCRRNRGNRFIAECRGGFSMVTIIGDSVDDQIYVHGVFEESTSDVVRRLSAEVESFLDIGCNIGYYSCLFRAAAPEKPLVAVDANPAMIERSRENFELNQFTGCKTLHCAVGDHPGTLTLHIPQNRHSLSSLAYVPAHGGPVHGIEVPVRTLADILAETNLDHSLVKIDTEGFEYNVFRGISKDAADRIRFVVFELSGPNLEQAGKTPRDIFELPVLEAFDAYLVPETPGAAMHEITPSDLDRVAAGGLSENVLLVHDDPVAKAGFARSGLVGDSA